jgi:hypothetical protein
MVVAKHELDKHIIEATNIDATSAELIVFLYAAIVASNP